MCQRVGVEFALTVKFNDPKIKREIFVRIDMKHSYFSNYLLCISSHICLSYKHQTTL